MAQYYQIQNLEELNQIYATDVQVLQIASDDGVNASNRTQHLLLQEDSLSGQQVVYQQSSPATNQTAYQQQTTHYIIGGAGDDVHQQRQLMVQQRSMNHQQQRAGGQHQHNFQQDQQQLRHLQPDHPLQHIQQTPQQTQQVYFTTTGVDRHTAIVPPNHQPGHHSQAQQTEVQQQINAQQQNQYQQQQQQSQQQQIVHQQHTIQQQQQQPPQQILYRMQTQNEQTPPMQQQTQLLNNAHVIHVHPILRQDQRIIYPGRVVYSAQQPQGQSIIHPSTSPHQQSIQLQTNTLHSPARLVQTRIANQQQSSPVQEPSVIFHPQIQKSPQHPQLQVQQPPHLMATTGIRNPIIRQRSPRGGMSGSPPTLLTRMQTTSGIRPSQQQLHIATGLQIPRPRGVGGMGNPSNRGGQRGSRVRPNMVKRSSIASSAGMKTQTVLNQTNRERVDPPIATVKTGDTNDAPQQQLPFMQQRPPAPQNVPQFRTPATVSSTQTQNNPVQGGQSSSPNVQNPSNNSMELDLEESIQAVVVKKDQVKGTGTFPPSSQAQVGTTLTYITKNKDDEEDDAVRSSNGRSITLSEYRKRTGTLNQPANSPIPSNSRNAITMRAGGPQIQTPASSSPKLPVTTAGQSKQQQNVQQQPADSQQQVSSAVHQTSHNNYEIQTQHVLQNRNNQQMAEKDRNSAKMLVILVSGEQRLITFTLPRESCTVQDLLEQVSVPFDSNTTIQCVENPGANIDFVVTVGFSVQESHSELISRAEQSLQLTKQHDSSISSAVTAAACASPNSASQGPSKTSTKAGQLSNASSSLTKVTNDSTKENTQSTVNNNSTTSPASKSTEEVPRKVIQGFYAMCSSCGYSSYDHAKCERCKRVFVEPPKRVPCDKTSNDSTPFNRGQGDLLEKRRSHDAATASRPGKTTLPYNPSNATQRGRGSTAGQRGRGSRFNRRNLEAPEPVILTLSSDEEVDNESFSMGDPNSTMPYGSKNMISSKILKPLAFELSLPEMDESSIYQGFKRGDVKDLSGCNDKLTTSVDCKLIRIGGYNFKPPERVILTSKGIQIVAPMVDKANETCILHIYKEEIVKIIAHFSKTSDSLLCFYTLRDCAHYIKTSLNMKDDETRKDGYPYFSAVGPSHTRKIILHLDSITDQARGVIKSIWEVFDEISLQDAQDLLQRAADAESHAPSKINSDSSKVVTTQLQPNEVCQLLIYPPGKGGISINIEDYLCLATDQYLNDIIIDFYLKWVHLNVIPEQLRSKTFIFSTFFYKRLTTLTRSQERDVKQTAAQKRHARVQNWTKNVNLFEKDFIIIPINEQSHWFLAIICFPNKKGPVTFDTNVPVELQNIKKQKGKKMLLQIGNTTITPLSKRADNSVNGLNEVCGISGEDSERDEAEGDDSDLATEDSDSEVASSTTTATTTSTADFASANVSNALSTQEQAIKQSLILIFDSLAGASRSRVVATLRDYLTCEYKVKVSDPEQSHVFNKDNMPGHCVKVPQQNNFTDCGLYLLQYVEHFFKNPIKDYRLPIKQLTNWFDTLTVTRKREDISILIQKLMNEKNGPNKKVILPEIPFPTQNGQLVEPPEGYNMEFEEDEDMEDAAGEEEEDASCSNPDGGSDLGVSGSNEVDNKKSTKSDTATLVPTHGRRIVVKRRIQLNSTCGEVDSAVLPRTSMMKLRKIEN